MSIEIQTIIYNNQSVYHSLMFLSVCQSGKTNKTIPSYHHDFSFGLFQSGKITVSWRITKLKIIIHNLTTLLVKNYGPKCMQHHCYTNQLLRLMGFFPDSTKDKEQHQSTRSYSYGCFLQKCLFFLHDLDHLWDN